VPGVTCLTPNRQEAFELAGITESRDGFPAAEIGQRIFSQHQARFLCVTMGADGMILYQAAGQFSHLPTVAREVFDVSGAGDTVVAVLTAGLAAGLNLHAAGHLANTAAGIVVGKIGTATVSAEELQNAAAGRC
jgi:D-beta-D-heptose 7-phosphate kinase/D-beta-D-heptose 1-phosphate adenosyltransferase